MKEYRVIALSSLLILSGCGQDTDDDNDNTTDWSNTKIEAVYLAQTHVLPPEAPLFKLVGNRDALLKVQVIDPNEVASPDVTVNLQLGDQFDSLTLDGPTLLPSTFNGEKGQVEHSFDDSFTVVIPAQWISPGLSIEVVAAEQRAEYDLNVGAPTDIKMKMFDIHYFGQGDSDYPAGTFAELAAKWPAASLSVERVRDINFPEMVIPARPDVGAPNVRITSTAEYQEKTGLRFDGEQAAALQWVHALSAAGGNQDTAMCYVNIIGVPAGGQAGGFDGVGAPSVGILNHELGHALSLPHWGNNGSYPYKGDMHGIPAPDTLNGTHVGPTWAFDLPTLTFIPPTVQEDSNRGVAGTYKASPMQGGGTGDQEAQFLMRHFSDYSVNQMQNYLESKVAINRNENWFKWNDNDKSYSSQIISGLGVRYPIEMDVDVISVMAATSLADMDLNMVYPPIGPYVGNLILTFDPTNAEDRALADSDYCPNTGCDFTLKVTQGGNTRYYMLAASGDPSGDRFNQNSLKTVAVNLRASDGEVTKVELLLTPDAEQNGLPASPDVLDIFQEEGDSGSDEFSWNDESIEQCTNQSNGPVKVFFLAGQSNMVGHGTVTPTQGHLDRNGGLGTLEKLVADNEEYANLKDNSGNWIERDDVWIANLSSTGKLSVGKGSNSSHIGPELAFGNVMGDHYDNQVLLIKTSWGGTSLAVDWRPPSSGGDTGPKYQEMLEYAQNVLSNLESELPGYQGQGFEIVGFGWHQGWNDRINQEFNDEYQTNLVNFINDLRQELTLTELPFVLATTGMSGWDETHPRALSLMNAQLAVPSDNRLNARKVAAIETRDFWRSAENSPADQGYHWNRNAESYYLIGKNLAESMLPLICQ
ncbi:sialate O-acetylesterase [Pleionea sediminis]|uniref:sialate O-acetylesterase n=1 Tax=Pleionea sediminis TaxID=2569479 RepID=UPI0011854455|nr:sialate O-acetylesterase [Pleionea sediminis]